MADKKDGFDVSGYLAQNNVYERRVFFCGVRRNFMMTDLYRDGGEVFPPTGDREEFLALTPGELEILIKNAKDK